MSYELYCSFICSSKVNVYQEGNRYTTPPPTMEYDTAIVKIGLETHWLTWMNFHEILLSKKSKMEIRMFNILVLICLRF